MSNTTVKPQQAWHVVPNKDFEKWDDMENIPEFYKSWLPRQAEFTTTNTDPMDGIFCSYKVKTWDNKKFQVLRWRKGGATTTTTQTQTASAPSSASAPQQTQAGTSNKWEKFVIIGVSTEDDDGASAKLSNNAGDSDYLPKDEYFHISQSFMRPDGSIVHVIQQRKRL